MFNNNSFFKKWNDTTTLIKLPANCSFVVKKYYIKEIQYLIM